MIDDRLAGWVCALVLMGALIVAARPRRRKDAWAAAALLVLYLLALVLAEGLLDGVIWTPVVAASAVWLAVQPLIGLGRLGRAELGLVPMQPGSSRPAVVVTLLALAANVLVMWLRGAAPIVGPAVVISVVVAAVVEEFVVRGVLLAFADRALPPRWRVAGALLGPGGLLLTAAFVVLHGLRPGLLIGVAPAAVLYLWLRARTGSLAAPIVAHALWNVSVVLMHI
ncbi:MAG TPA: CPBP family intramembrane glutamic endopeptidase [Burkholderiaceae bacterium]|nr:CPBP family intramembrane glutamic endopeptidase [Burkholderiaceae bacterium]